MTNSKITRYFAAANSYNGFVSYFDKVFPSAEFDRIYVIKGGPGTGKSSLMRQFSNEFKSQHCEIEEILCSSDPNSLDGIIIKNNQHMVAFIDGTAPHVREANLPGVKDEIINLGENWDDRWLRSQEKEICTKANQKAKAYKSAYNYLKIAGACHNVILEVYRANFSITRAKSLAESIVIDKNIESNSVETHKLISSFGRNGNYVLPFPIAEKINKYGICGNEYTTALFLEYLRDSYKIDCFDMTLYHSALDCNLLDGIELSSHDMIICKDENGNINCDELATLSQVENESIRSAIKIKEEAIDEAKRHFLIASNIHFDLEKIYSEAMNFDRNNDIFLRKSAEIKNIVEFSR